MLAAMVGSAVVAYAVAKICIRLRADYLAIATIGIAEIIRLVFKSEGWATNGRTTRFCSRHKSFDALLVAFCRYVFLTRKRLLRKTYRQNATRCRPDPH